MSYCGDVGDLCACCGERIGLDSDGAYICACTTGKCKECNPEEEDQEAET